MTQKLLVASVSLFAIAAPSSVSFEEESFLAEQNILQRLPKPLLDFDSDRCYNTAAMDPSGRINSGKGATGTPYGQCCDPPQLDNSKACSRKRCNNGYCTVIYEYCFEKDQAVGGSCAGGHRHGWDNIVVFNLFPLNDHHPLLVYHEDDGGYCSRSANRNDIAHPENPFGGFYCSPLVGWNKGPSIGLRNKMLNAWKGSVGSNLDHEFCDSLDAAAGNALPGFNLYIDSQGANWPHL
ncbi:necrosis inducing protein-domain-containing protein [Ilyonectria robusta]|uniref:necrosis inducing protein-domain-containing protein n=1 Tax=Ilyonectria robusta TaxID=1079257 RepID=UPI001E8E7429|nr:necrosis inducing protein-domain-containing protein [Ilyonectria robusta]KAH8680485.1 necrosis inducing protein-domain-containing protein [Ilyonectria robusta]